MNLQYRLDLLSRLREYISSENPEFLRIKERAYHENSWFIPEFIDLSCRNIANSFLDRKLLEDWVKKYDIPQDNKHPRSVGIIMAGNIPLVGFHDLLCVFISGNKALIKTSSKDEALIKHIAEKMAECDPQTGSVIQFAEMLKSCHAYIATGNNNSSRYFDYYFGKYPHIIRRNRTSVAILSGDETKDELEKLADDVYLYFGLGCRNVTKIHVPPGYDFIPILDAFKKYNYFADIHKYKNNYDYNLALHILNKKFYMTNGSVILSEEESLFSPIGQLNYEYYNEKEKLVLSLQNHPGLQCLVGKDQIPFGKTQYPSINDYADGVDTLLFLKNL